MIKITNPEDCCGCTACASICAHDAITMEPDAMGFLYPKVDVAKCTNCGLCDKVCAFNDNYDKSLNLPQPDVYGARHKDMSQVETSRSGAAFIALSDFILDQGGVVYGVGYSGHFHVVHKRAVTRLERDEFKGSKYVQSDLSGIFRQVKQDLKDGRIVLFSGTPCQTSGLNSYVGKSLRENLILVDIVCHGVPGPYVWEDYISFMEKGTGKIITGVDFRNKRIHGWSAHFESFKYDDDSDFKSYRTWTNLFCKNIMLRHSCGKCHFTNIVRPSDITIADFWQKRTTICYMNEDNKGLSLLFINSEKGRTLFELVLQYLNIQRIDLDEYVKSCMQTNLSKPSTIHPKRDEFESDYLNYGFSYVINKDYYKKSFVQRVVLKTKRIIKKFILR